MTACKSNLKNLGVALEMYSTDNLGDYPLSSSQLTPRYLKTIPTCPTVGSVTYVMSLAPKGYTIVCGGKQHEGAGIREADYPQYTSVTGLIERP